VDLIIRNLNKNTENAKKILAKLINNIHNQEECPQCSSALRFAIVTDKNNISKKAKKDLNIIIGKYVR